MDNDRKDLQKLFEQKLPPNDYNEVLKLFKDLDTTQAKAMFCAIVHCDI